jgi:hypothetical protein
VWKKIFTNFKSAFTILEKKNPTTSNNIIKNDVEQITTESGIANKLAAQFGKTCSTKNYPSNFKKRKEAAEKVEITINIENNDPYNGPLTEEELYNALHECKGTI